MAAGKLRERIVIQRKVSTPDGGGGNAVSWQDVATLWARVMPKRGNEALEAAQLRGVQLYEVVVRYGADIKTTDRIGWDGTLLNIRAIANRDEHNRYLTLIAEDGVTI